MSSSINQVNYDVLTQIAKQLHSESEEHAQLNVQTRQRMDALQGGWQGDAAKAFFGEMNGTVLPASQRVVGALQAGESVLNQIMQIIRQADEETASYFKSAGADGGDQPPPPGLLPQAFSVGWDWLTEQGGGSSKDHPMVFGPNEQMTQDLMHSEGFREQVWQKFLDSGGKTDDYSLKVDLESYYKGFIFKATWTETFIGSYTAHIVNNGDGTATVTIENRTGIRSLTHFPSANYDNPSIQTIIQNWNNNPFSYMPDHFPTSLNDFWTHYLPSGILNGGARSEPGPGGDMYQVYTWTQPIP